MTKKLKKPIAFLTVFAMFLSMLVYFPAGTFGSFDFGVRASAAGTITPSQPTIGDGSSGNPYQITSAAELYWFADCVKDSMQNLIYYSVYAILMNDITLNENVLDEDGNLNPGPFNEWTPIEEYRGFFDGNNKTIKGLYINLPDTDNVGFISKNTRVNESINNLTLEDFYICGKSNVGAFCGYTSQTTLTGCTTKNGKVVGKGDSVGGLVGYQKWSTLKGCENNAVVEGYGEYIGGISGYMYGDADWMAIITECRNNGAVTGYGTVDGTTGETVKGGNVGGIAGYVEITADVTDSCNSGAVTGCGSYVGGIVGQTDNAGHIFRCVNEGAVYGKKDYVGGVIGKFRGFWEIGITKCTNKGSVTADGDYVGGIAGLLSSSSTGYIVLKSCYNEGNVKGHDYVAGGCGVSEAGAMRSVFSNASVEAEGSNFGGVKGSVNSRAGYCVYNLDRCPGGSWSINGNIGLTAEQLKSGMAAVTLKTGDSEAYWVQQLSVDDYPYMSDDPTYTVYEGGTTGYHNHQPDQDFCRDCGPAPIEPPTNADGTYRISTKNHLYWFSMFGAGKKAVLTANIVVNEDMSDPSACYFWKPIGTEIIPFSGVFDGQGHTISGLYYEDANAENIGLFGYIKGGTVLNVGVVNSYFKGKKYVGGIAGRVNNPSSESSSRITISGCFSKAEVIGSSYIGGVYGDKSRGTINNSYYLDTAVAGASDSSLAMTAAQFISGEVAYKLNGDTGVWGMIINGTNDIPKPINAQNRVYYGENEYHNHESASVDAGYCEKCHVYIPVKPDTNDDGEYIIDTVNKLYWFACLVNGKLDDVAADTAAKGILDADITVNADLIGADGNPKNGEKALWTPIGEESVSFTGSFDGKGYTISGLYFNDSNESYVGLFGTIGNGGTVSNVGIVNSSFTGNDYVGAVAGKNNGAISGCFTNTIQVNGTTSGDICGQSDGTVKRCFYLEGGRGAGEAKTEAQFTSGEVAYLLNGDRTNIVWGQLIYTDPLPVPVNEANRVYFAQGVYHNHTSGTDCRICPVEPDFVDGKYQISTEQHLLWLAEYVNSTNNMVNAVLVNNIAVSDGFVMTPIGTAEKPFNGSFDGKCCGISNLNINTTSDNAGLFGVIGTSGMVSNLAVTSSTIEGNGNVGGIAGTNNGKISGCYTFGLTLYGAATTAGSGTAEHSFSTSITILGAQKTAEQFKNGDVAYNLNADPANPVWGQLVNSAAEPLPVAVTAENQVFYAEEIGYHNHGATDCPYCPVEPRTVDGVYQLSTANHLWWFAEFVNGGGSPADAVLLNNISISTNVDMIPIGTQAHPFNGSFNGNGYTISGLNF
ncbi:MAG: hypothetical protein ACI4KM_12180, partial [Oscillospiraceae bacterium]